MTDWAGCAPLDVDQWRVNTNGTPAAVPRIQGEIATILSDFSKLCFAQSNRTFAAVRLLPPFENGIS
jgi:hypothetical protein